jgi:ferric-dicitrate binding protein FerR (iron transport regulator)
VRAVGTEFGVSVADGEVVVTVAEGKVAVTDNTMAAARKGQTPPTPAVVPLGANEQITLSRDGSESVRRVDAEHELQWASGSIEGQGETIGEIVEQFNRRNSLRIVIDDPEVGRIALSYFKLQLDEPGTFADLVDTRSDVKAVRKRDAIHLEHE